MVDPRNMAIAGPTELLQVPVFRHVHASGACRCAAPPAS